jgi:hypothetical protein
MEKSCKIDSVVKIMKSTVGMADIKRIKEAGNVVLVKSDSGRDDAVPRFAPERHHTTSSVNRGLFSAD